MDGIQHIGRLEIEQDDGFQRRDWRFQTCGRAGILLLVGLAFVGLFGKGGFSRATASNETLSVRYERFARWDTATQIEIALPGALQGDVRLSLNSSYASRVRISEFAPPPVEVAAEADRLVYAFRLRETRGPITLFVTPTEPGLLRLRLAVGSGPELALWQYVWP